MSDIHCCNFIMKQLTFEECCSGLTSFSKGYYMGFIKKKLLHSARCGGYTLTILTASNIWKSRHHSDFRKDLQLGKVKI